MTIQDSISRFEERASGSRKFMLRAFSALITCFALGFVFNSLSHLLVSPGPAFGPIWSLCTFGAMAAFCISVIRYWMIHRPALEKCRMDWNAEMMKGLQQQIIAPPRDTKTPLSGSD